MPIGCCRLFPIREGGFNFSTQDRRPPWVRISNGGSTTQIASARRDLQNVPLDLYLKPPNSALGTARPAPNRLATPVHVYACCSRPVSRARGRVIYDHSGRADRKISARSTKCPRGLVSAPSENKHRTRNNKTHGTAGADAHTSTRSARSLSEHGMTLGQQSGSSTTYLLTMRPGKVLCASRTARPSIKVAHAPETHHMDRRPHRDLRKMLRA